MSHKAYAPAVPRPAEPAAQAGLPLTDEAREALIGRLDAWLEEEERLLAEIEQRIAANRGTPASVPNGPAPSPRVQTTPSPWAAPRR